MPLDVSITNEQRVKVTAAPMTSTGRPAAVDGPVRVATISGDAIGSEDPSDPLSVWLTSADSPGDSTFLISADADLGAGEVLVEDVVTLHVAGSMAASLGLVAGTPEAKP